jgi:hypothetical protein
MRTTKVSSLKHRIQLAVYLSVVTMAMHLGQVIMQGAGQ